MEKTTNIILGGVRFDMTEEAFHVLDAYLKSLASHFSADADRAEIIRDIEGRIAEKLTEAAESPVSLTTIESVTAQIGAPEDISSEESEVPTPSFRKLYRDADAAIIGGVSAGIAAYLGVDALYVRLAFIASVFLGGTGIVIYILLWLLLPVALTASQKLEMRGSAVTLKTMQELIRRNGSDDVRGSMFQRIIYFPFEVIGSMLRGMSRFWPGLRTITGAIIAIGSFFAILGITTFALLAAVNMHAPSIEFPLLDALSPLLLYGLMLAAYLATVIPIVFVLVLALRLVRSTARITPVVGFGLVGIWSLAVIATGALGFRAAVEYQNYLQTAPEYQEVTERLELDRYQSIDLSSGTEVRVVSGEEQGATLTASKRDLARIKTSVADGVLTVEALPIEGNCIFCEFSRPVLTITAPDLESIRMQGGILVFQDFVDDSLVIEAQGGRISGSIVTQGLDVSGENFSLDLSGSARTATMRIDNASVRAPSLEIGTLSIEARDYSSARLWVSGRIDAFADCSSEITYRGTPASATGNAASEDAQSVERED